MQFVASLNIKSISVSAMNSDIPYEVRCSFLSQNWMVFS